MNKKTLIITILLIIAVCIPAYFMLTKDNSNSSELNLNTEQSTQETTGEPAIAGEKIENEEIGNEQAEYKDEETEQVSEEVDIKADIKEEIETIKNNQEKEKACRLMNELKTAPAETKIAYYTESSHQPINASWAPDTTEELLKYLRDYMQNYNETGSVAFTHIPDYMPDFAEQYIPILEARWQEYLVQKNICEN